VCTAMSDPLCAAARMAHGQHLPRANTPSRQAAGWVEISTSDWHLPLAVASSTAVVLDCVLPTKAASWWHHPRRAYGVAEGQGPNDSVNNWALQVPAAMRRLLIVQVAGIAQAGVNRGTDLHQPLRYASWVHPGGDDVVKHGVPSLQGTAAIYHQGCQHSVLLPQLTVSNLATSMGIERSVRRNVSPLTSSQLPSCWRQGRSTQGRPCRLCNLAHPGDRILLEKGQEPVVNVQVGLHQVAEQRLGGPGPSTSREYHVLK
jgi:hypothetical protein